MAFKIWPYCRLFIFTPLSQGKWLSCSLSPTQTLFTHIKLNTLKHSDFTSWPFAKNLTFFHKIDNFLAHMSALGPYSLLPFRHMTTSLPQKDSCLNRLCLLWVSYSISLLSLGLSPDYHNVYLPSWLISYQDIHFLACHCSELNLTQLKATRLDIDDCDYIPIVHSQHNHITQSHEYCSPR